MEYLSNNENEKKNKNLKIKKKFIIYSNIWKNKKNLRVVDHPEVREEEEVMDNIEE